MNSTKLLTLYIILHLTVIAKIFSQSENTVAPKQIPNRVQVTVSGNHPDAINNEATVIYDNTKNIDYRSSNRPIKTTIPSSDTEEELFLPNEVIPTLSIEEVDLNSLPETEEERKEEYERITNDEIPYLISNERNKPIIYSGTEKQNIELMKSLNIVKGWNNNEKWPDGTDVDEYSIVDWIKAGKGISIGIGKNSSMEIRANLYKEYVLSKEK